jgi:hypothetical protein
MVQGSMLVREKQSGGVDLLGQIYYRYLSVRGQNPALANQRGLMDGIPLSEILNSTFIKQLLHYCEYSHPQFRFWYFTQEIIVKCTLIDSYSS